MDGKVDAQPLYASAVAIPGQGTHNVLFVATEHDSVYAFDADNGGQLWKVSLLQAGETPSDDRGCGQVTPEIGITATPVIDRSSGPNGTIYVVAMSKDSSSAYHQRLHALDITSGAEEFGGPKEVQATFPGTGDNTNGSNVIFDPAQYDERPGLLLLNQTIYTSWSSHCDLAPYTAWIIAYNEATLNQVNVLDLTPNGHEGSVWMSGAWMQTHQLQRLRLHRGIGAGIALVGEDPDPLGLRRLPRGGQHLIAQPSEKPMKPMSFTPCCCMYLNTTDTISESGCASLNV